MKKKQLPVILNDRGQTLGHDPNLSDLENLKIKAGAAIDCIAELVRIHEMEDGQTGGIEDLLQMRQDKAMAWRVANNLLKIYPPEEQS